mmetsp:Transcript_28170/g.45257  ORF Transcript_28170/g.45257 Transcript_28170/m.45257 type:complete len:487 (-) Transcript_28170:720-2180(-)
MERVLAGWFTEGSSYLSNVWSSKGSDIVHEEKNDEAKETMARTVTNESATSSLSTSSRASSSSTSSRKFQKVMSWMVFGSKKVLSKKTTSGNYDLPESSTSNKKTPLDVLLFASKERNHTLVDPTQLNAVSVIGRGGYGKVMLMRSKETGSLIAVKEVPKSNLIDKPGVASRSVRPVSTKIEHAEMENMVLQTISQHPFVTSFHGSFQNREKIFILMEYCAGGELFQHMQRQGVFSESRTCLYAAEIVLALEFLHEKGIVYRDLKPENILLDGSGHIRLADFGLSIQFNKEGDDNSMRCFSICGTPEYIAPEIILMATTKKNDRGFTYGKTVDWWALGILTYEMLFRIPPFYHRDRKTMLNKILTCELQFPNNPKQKPVSADSISFISSLLRYNEEDRLGYGNNGSQNVKAHPFFASLDFELVSKAEVEPEFVPELKNYTDTGNFDVNFTKELLREDICSPCAFNLELTGYDFLPEGFAESAWFSS